MTETESYKRYQDSSFIFNKNVIRYFPHIILTSTIIIKILLISFMFTGHLYDYYYIGTIL